MNGRSALHQRVFHYAHVEVEELYQDLQLTESGYQKKEVEKNREKYGENFLKGRGTDTIFYRLQRAFINPFSIILLLLAGVSFVTDVLLASNFSRNMTTVIIILCMLLISGVVRFVQEMRSKHVTDQFFRLLHTNITVRREGSWKKISSAELVVGDQVRLFAGDRVPADLRITEANHLFVSQSVLTGESAILEKEKGVLPKEEDRPFRQYSNILFMGSVIVGGSGEGIVLTVGRDTVYGGFSDTESSDKNGFDQGANSIARVLIRFMVVLVPIVFVIGGFFQDSWMSAFLFALSVAVGLTPEMLPMVVNACLAKGSAAMGKKQTVVKNINAMQGFGSMDVLCVDKTGTLTGDTIWLEYYMDILGNESEKVLHYAYLNSIYHTGIKNHLDAAILKCEEMPGKQTLFSSLVKKHPKLGEVPFDYERKFVSVLVKGENENLLIIKGSLEEVCQRCRYVEYKNTCKEMEEEKISSIRAIVDDMLQDGMKVIAVAYKPVEEQQGDLEEERDFILLGYLAFFDAPKKTAADAIKKLQKLHVGIRVLTGDQKSVAVSICRRLDIDITETITGSQIDALTDEELPARIEKTTVFAELSPRQKAFIVRILRENGHSVGFLGDGMNDLPAIVEADVGISVDTATEAVKEIADVILLKKDLNVLEEGIQEGRKAFANMLKYIKITSSSNFGNIFSIVIASAMLPFFPMTSVQLLLLNLLYDILCLVLPWDSVDEEVCARPLEWSGRTLGRFMRVFGPVSSIFDLLTFGFLFFVLCPSVCGGDFTTVVRSGGEETFRSLFQTGWFLESMWTQVLILHLLRTKKIPLLQSKPSWVMLIVTTLGIIVFTLLTFTPLGVMIGLTALPRSYFLFLIFIVLSYLIVVSLAKSWYVKKYHTLY